LGAPWVKAKMKTFEGLKKNPQRREWADVSRLWKIEKNTLTLMN
jgi:hypothetical protein